MLSVSWTCACLGRDVPETEVSRTLRAQGWARRSVDDHAEPVRVFFATSLNYSQIDEEISAVSDPCSDRYAQYLTLNQTRALLGAHTPRSAVVERWLHTRGIAHEYTDGLYTLDLPVGHSQELFNATYYEYTHHDGRRSLHAEAHQVPEELRDHLDVFGPGVGRSAPRAAPPTLLRRDDGDDDDTQLEHNCDIPVYPSCMRALYGTDKYKVKAAHQHRIGVAGFLHEAPELDDLRAYAQKHRPEAGNASYKMKSVSRAANRTLHDTSVPKRDEANVDVQMVVTQAWPIPVTYYFAAGTPPHTATRPNSGRDNEPFLSLFHYLLSVPDDELPSVVSLSYLDTESTVPEAYARRVCSYAALLGLRGVTLVVGSGDDGVGPADASKCGAGDTSPPQFTPWFPASCPYVTAVGGTATPPNEIVADREHAGYVSGSGFSNYFARPAWQQAVVDRYLNASVDPAYRAYFHMNGRAYPDVAAQSAHVAMEYKSNQVKLSGTSVSAPLFASVAALLNDARLAANQTRLGFLNPLLYGRLSRAPGAFHDIREGGSSGCGLPGFNATDGWDVASGFGTPSFPALRDAVLDARAHCAPK